MIYELPMTNDASQEFICELNKVKYLFRVQLNVRGGVWTLDVNTSEDERIIAGLPLVMGIDFLATERFTSGMLFLVDYAGTGLDPTAKNFGNYGLIWDDGNDRQR